MHLELAQLQHYVVTPDKDVGNINIELPPERAPDEVPWRRPLDLRLRAALRLGVLLSFVLAGLLLMIMRALNVSQEAAISVRAEARALAASASFGLAQNDRRSVLALLEGLAEKKHIAGVALYDMKGKRFADYAVSNAALLQLPALGSDRVFTSEFWSNHFPGAVVMWEPAKTRFENVGWLVIEANLSSRWEAFFSELSWMGAALLASLLFCTGIIGKVQQRIAEPMYRLARTSKVIVEDRDYTLRAWKDARDEMGSVTDCFNHLLDEIQRRGNALVQLREEMATTRNQQQPEAVPSVPSENDSQRRHGQFLVNMCHEIRTPMNRAMAISKKLSASGLTPEQQEMLSSVRGAGEWVITLTDDLLDFSRMGAGKLELRETDFNPGELMDTLVQMYHDRAVAKQILLRAMKPDTLPGMVRGDVARIRQVMGCLVSNSVKFSQGGEICIEVSIVSRKEGRAQFCFEVRDSGFGIAEEARSRILQSLSVPDATTIAPSGSAGLGLVVANHLVSRMGGTLEPVGPRADGQAGFRLLLPLMIVRSGPLPAYETAAIGQDVRSALPISNVATKTDKCALIFDDAMANRKSLRGMLQKLDYRVEAAANIEEVRERCQQHPFDVIFANDKCLARHEGALDTLRAVWERVPNAAPCAIVVTFARGQEGTLMHRDVPHLAFPFRRKDVEVILRDGPSNATSPSSFAVMKSPINGHTPLPAAALNDVVEIYLDSAPELIEQLKAALGRAESSLAAETARTLRACSAKIGAAELASLCEQIESQALSGDFLEPRSVVRALDQAFLDAQTILGNSRLLSNANSGPTQIRKKTSSATA